MNQNQVGQEFMRAIREATQDIQEEIKQEIAADYLVKFILPVGVLAYLAFRRRKNAS